MMVVRKSSRTGSLGPGLLSVTVFNFLGPRVLNVVSVRSSTTFRKNSQAGSIQCYDDDNNQLQPPGNTYPQVELHQDEPHPHRQPKQLWKQYLLDGVQSQLRHWQLVKGVFGEDRVELVEVQRYAFVIS